MSWEPGTRVFAVLSADQEEIRLLGFGTYVGEQPCPIKRRFIEDGGRIDLADFARQLIEQRDMNGTHGGATEEFLAGMDADAVRAGHITPEEAARRPARRAVEAAAARARPMEERIAEQIAEIISNPKIQLDDGGETWGIQCWWGPEAGWERFRCGRRVVQVAVPE